MSGLEDLGFRTAQQRALDALADPALRPARVLARDRGSLLVDDGEGERSLPIAGRLRRDAELGEGDYPATGDWVVVGGDVVVGVLPRRGVISRATDDGVDVIAANVDLLLVAHAVAQDEALARIPRFLALAADGAVPAVVLLTKIDLLEDRTRTLAEVADITGGTARVLPISSRTGENLDAVRALATPGDTLALAGASGAGKSTLVNALRGDERQATGEVRESDGRGRHVTVRRELLRLPGGGLLVDTPGLRAVGVRGGIEASFDDVAELAAQCRFSNCTHTTEPGCAVREAIESGELPAERLAESVQLTREADHAAAREDAALARARAREHRATDTSHTREQRERRKAK